MRKVYTSLFRGGIIVLLVVFLMPILLAAEKINIEPDGNVGFDFSWEFTRPARGYLQEDKIAEYLADNGRKLIGKRQRDIIDSLGRPARAKKNADKRKVWIYFIGSRSKAKGEVWICFTKGKYVEKVTLREYDQ
ncbi:MAG: hypothetical protein KKF93_02010 [Candidatus Omnitrophica bacterium]|nr:hypothetical protein [Candidatus Omnitrophota bacterium]